MSINRVLGRGATRTLGGRDYKFSALTQNIQGDYEEYFWQQIQDQAKGNVELQALLTERKAGGEYDFFSLACVRSVNTIKGVLKLTWLMLLEHQPRITQDEVQALVLTFRDDIQGVIAEALKIDDPKNPAAPATTS